MEGVWKGILDWSKIATVNDLKEVNINNGIAFEDIIELLLKAQFNDDYWVRTQQTHDGKKDYVHPNEITPTEWLECKNYCKRLSINTISPTLVMGSINGISRIYIYSRSPLNANALEDICLYRQAQSSDIVVYDGELLEYCIYLHRTQYDFKKYFQEINSRETANKFEIEHPSFFYSLRDMHGNKLTSKYKFRLGESFKLNIIVQNRRKDKLNFSITINNRKCKIKLSQQRINDSLNFGELKIYTVVCEALCAGKTNLSIKISHNQSKNKTGFLPVIEIKDEPYCFLIPKWLNLKNTCLSDLYSMKDIPVVLYGGSGTGKSTLIKQIFADSNLNKKYTLLNFDTRNQCVSIMENLVLQVAGLHKVRDLDDNSFVIEDISEILSRYFLSFEQFAEKFAKMGTVEKPFLCIIDDAQSLSYLQTSFLKTLKQVLNQNGRNLSFLFTLNSDKMQLDDFLKLMCWDKLSGDVNCKVINIPNFTKKDITNYFAYGYGITETENIFEDFNREISPLVVSNFVNMLKKKRVIQKLSQNDGRYVILDDIAFRQNVSHFLFAENTLKKIYEDYGYKGYTNYLLKYVYLNGAIQTKQIAREEDIEDLVSAQVFKQNGCEYMFAHEKLREAATEFFHFDDDDYVNIFYDDFTTTYAKAICAIAEVGKIREAKTYLKNFFNNTANNLLTEECLTVCKCIIENIDNLWTYELADVALAFVKNSYKILNKEIGREKLSELLSDAAEMFLSRSWWVKENNVASVACFLLKKHLDRILSLHKNENCEQCAQSCIDKMQEVLGLSEKDKNYWLCHFYNRRAIALSRLNKDAENDYEQSYLLSQAANNYEELELQITIDDFHRHYNYENDFTEDLARDYLYRLENLDSTKLNNKIDNLNYHIALLRFLLIVNDREKIDNPQNILYLAQSVIDTNTSPYYSLKMRILKIYFLLYKRDFCGAEKTYFETLEFAYIHEFRGFVYRLNYIYAHLLKWNDKTSSNGEDFADVALLTLKQFADEKIGSNKDYD